MICFVVLYPYGSVGEFSFKGICYMFSFLLNLISLPPPLSPSISLTIFSLRNINEDGAYKRLCYGPIKHMHGRFGDFDLIRT